MQQLAQALALKLEGYREEMLFHFKELLKMDTVQEEPRPGAPFGRGVRRALDYVLGLSRRFGLETVDMDGYIGYSEYGEGPGYVCSIAHLDVVPPGEGWHYPPFGAEEHEGVLYARGAGDDKPGCIAGLYALRCMKELGYKPRHRVRVIYGCAEETGMQDLDHYLQAQPLPLFGFTPDSDGYDIVNAEKGRMEFCVSAPLAPDAPLVRAQGGLAANTIPDQVTAVFDTSRMTPDEQRRLARAAEGAAWRRDGALVTARFEGVAAHAAFPQSGRSALAAYARCACGVLGPRADALTRFADKIGFELYGASLGMACPDDFMGPLTLCLCRLYTEGGRLWAVGDVRYPTAVTGAQLAGRLRRAADEAGLQLQVLSAADGHHCVDENAFGILRAVCLDKGKPEPRRRALAGGTYAKKFGGRLVAFGGCGDGVHGPDEFVPVADFYDHVGMVAHALYRLSGEL